MNIECEKHKDKIVQIAQIQRIQNLEYFTKDSKIVILCTKIPKIYKNL